MERLFHFKKAIWERRIKEIRKKERKYLGKRGFGFVLHIIE